MRFWIKILFDETVEGEEKDQEIHIFCLQVSKLHLHKRGFFIEGFQVGREGGNSDLRIMEA